MRRRLAGCATAILLVAISCGKPTKGPAPQSVSSVEPLPHLADGALDVSVRTLKVTGALSRKDALIGLADALPHLLRAVTAGKAKGDLPQGTFGASFRTEPDGTIRMLLDGENHLSGPGASDLVEALVASTMGHKWRFPPAAGPSLVEVEFAIATR